MSRFISICRPRGLELLSEMSYEGSAGENGVFAGADTLVGTGVLDLALGGRPPVVCVCARVRARVFACDSVLDAHVCSRK